DEVPLPALAGDELLERLLAAGHDARLVALAERLDHARHLHLRPAAGWRAFHTLACETYLPVALRTDPTLARRFRWWCGQFERRYLSGAAGRGEGATPAPPPARAGAREGRAPCDGALAARVLAAQLLVQGCSEPATTRAPEAGQAPDGPGPGSPPPPPPS